MCIEWAWKRFLIRKSAQAAAAAAVCRVTSSSWTVNISILWVVFAIMAPDSIVPPLLTIMSAVTGVWGVCVCVTRGHPVVSPLVQSRDNTLWRQRSLIIPFKPTEHNPFAHSLLLPLLPPSPPLPPQHRRCIMGSLLSFNRDRQRRERKEEKKQEEGMGA